MDNPDAWGAFDQLGCRDPASLSEDESLLLAFGQLRTELNHGGFDFYFRYCGVRASAALAAVQAADSPALFSLLEEAIALVGPETLQLGDDNMVSYQLEQVERELQELDRRFYDLEDNADLDAALSRLATRLRH